MEQQSCDTTQALKWLEKAVKQENAAARHPIDKCDIAEQFFSILLLILGL